MGGAAEYKAYTRIIPSTQIHLLPSTLDYSAKIFYKCTGGRLPTKPLPIMSNDSIADPSRVPRDKYLLKFLILSVPYQIKHDDASDRITKEKWIMPRSNMESIL